MELGAVKGVGQGAVEALIAEREAHGAFRSLADLCRRTDLTRINRRTLEALIRSGSMDSIGPNRATLLASLPAAMQLGDQTARGAPGRSERHVWFECGTVTVRGTGGRYREGACRLQ